MPRISWDASGERLYEIGLDRGVLYVDGADGVPWNGLISVDEKSSGGAATSYYVDGVKYQNVSAPEEFAGTVTAFMFPDEFMICDGTQPVDNGLFIKNQPRKQFSMAYRTKVGNDVAGDTFGYKLHLIYNCLAAPSDRQNQTTSDSPSPINFSWDITAKPPVIPGYRPSAHLMIDTRIAHPGAVSDAENILYGTNAAAPRMPTIAEMIEIFEENATLRITDNADGTWTATTAVDGIIVMIPGGYDRTILDNFDDNSFDTTIWSTPDGAETITEANGKINIVASSSFPDVVSIPTNDLSTGFYAAQYSHSGTFTGDENFYFGASDVFGNLVLVRYIYADELWASDVEQNASASNQNLLSSVTLAENDWIGLGNLGDDNVVHAYHSTDGLIWTEFYNYTVGGDFAKDQAELCVVIGEDTDGSTLTVSLDNAAFLTPAADAFQITWDSAEMISDDSYTITSL